MKIKTYLIVLAIIVFVGALPTGQELPGVYAQPTSPPKIIPSTDCSWLTFYGFLCHDTDDGKIYKWNGATQVELASGAGGDIEAVWGCATGDCSALTAAAGDTFNAGSADSAAPFKSGLAAALPGACTIGQTYYATDTKTFYVCSASNTWSIGFILAGAVNTLWGNAVAGTPSWITNWSFDDSAALVYNVTNPTRKIKLDASGISVDSKTVSIKPIGGVDSTILTPTITAASNTLGFLGTDGNIIESIGAGWMNSVALDAAAYPGNTVRYRHVPYAATITEWTILCEQNVGATAFVVDIWKLAYAADTLPTVANTITAAAKPTVATGGHKTGQSSTLTGWTTTVAAGDVFGFKIDTTSTVTDCSISLKLRRIP